jgi:hypothetical protein
MAHLRYFVFEEQSNWKIGLDGQVLGGFLSEQAAMSTAIERAFSNSMHGHKAEILVRDKNTGAFKVAWSYGRK